MNEKKKVRLLVIFFISMIIFTLLSRAADAITIAKVVVAKVEKGIITYELKGTGTVKEANEKKIRTEDGYKIKKLYVEQGNKIEVGDLLFVYDLKNLQDKKKLLEKEEEKLKLEYEKRKLGSTGSDNQIEMKQLLLDLQYAKEDLEQVQGSIDLIKSETQEKKQLEQAEWEKNYKEIKKNIDKIKKSIKEAKRNFELEEKEANRRIKDAQVALDALDQSTREIDIILEAYKKAVENGSEQAKEKARHNLFDIYYKEAYEAHVDELEKAETTLERLLEDEKDMEEWYEKNINDWDQYDPDLVKAYEQQVKNREEERKKYKRQKEDLQKTIAHLKEQDEKLMTLLNQYQDVLMNDPIKSNVESIYNKILELLKIEKIEDSEYEKAYTTLERAKEDKEILETKWKEEVVYLEEEMKAVEETKQETEEKIAQLEEEQLAIKEGRYGFEKELAQVEEEIKNKERALEKIELQIEQTKETKQNTLEQEREAQKIEQLNLAGILLDLEEKKEEIQQTNDLLKEGGKIYSKIQGEVKELSFEEGATVSSQDYITIIIEGYELSASASREELKYFQVGDEIEVKLEEEKQIKATISEIEKTDQNGICTFTIDLPEEDFKMGDILSYSTQKKSANYPKCIDINAIRQDEYGTYVLILQKKNGILGEEIVTTKRNVTILERDTKKAAIDSQITEDQEIVIGSNKNIEEGDRVRMNESGSK